MDDSFESDAIKSESVPRLPDAETYELEYRYWPWGELIKRVAHWIELNAPPSAHIVDYMCGTGYLLNEVSKRRDDISVSGCSITEEFIEYARREYENINIHLEDALEYEPDRTPDLIVATAGLHHLSREKQDAFVKKVASELRDGGVFILGEEVIAPYENEKERRLAVLELWNALTKYTINQGAPESVLEAAATGLGNDLAEKGEYKLSRRELIDLLEDHLVIQETAKMWPSDSEAFGDIIFRCTKG